MRGIHRSPVNSPCKGQWREALMLTLICAWTNGWVNNRDTFDLRRHCAHHCVAVMWRNDGTGYISYCQYCYAPDHGRLKIPKQFSFRPLSILQFYDLIVQIYTLYIYIDTLLYVRLNNALCALKIKHSKLIWCIFQDTSIKDSNLFSRYHHENGRHLDVISKALDMKGCYWKR